MSGAGPVAAGAASARTTMQPGVLLDYQKLPEVPAPLGAAYRITYTSTTAEGTPTTVTGTVIESTAPWQGPGARPVMVMAPGTRGQLGMCGPSSAQALLGGIDRATGAVNMNYELPHMVQAAARGYRVVVTDYMGLNPAAPEIHRYVNTLDEAHSVLDAARASLQLGGWAADTPVVMYGYSQGGGAVAAAAENAGTYAPELNLKGSFAGGTPADLTPTIAAVDQSAIMGVLGYALNGMALHDTAAYDAAIKHFSPHGREVLDQLSRTCIPDAAARFGFRSTRELTVNGESMSDIIDQEPAVRAYLEAQRIGKKKLNAPLMVANGVNDEIIPFNQARDMARNFCASGGQVTFYADNAPAVPGRTGAIHIATMMRVYDRALFYLTERLDDSKPVPLSCGEF